MSKIKFEVEIEATNVQHVIAVTNFLQAIGNTAEAATPAAAPKEDPKKVEAPAPKQETKKAEAPTPKQEPAKEETKKAEAPTPKQEPAKEETKKAEAPKEDPKKAENNIDISKVRALLATKVGDHRAEIKNELTKLGATSVSTLDAEHYQAFADFLNSL